ncbi:MAG TPA: NAD-dependent epimerase/dehydratase family protein [Phototrophicaceae bacterium]|nr:NAD-dependent epimerase/dehydratase family protein [Phototrophicaceae bacterium]
MIREQFWLGRPVFVTGATGFVGSWLIKRLLGLGAQVAALVHHPNPQSEFYRSGDYLHTWIIQGNLEDFATLEYAINKFGIKTVFHLGAQSQVGAAQRSPLPTFEANIRGTYNLLEACRYHRTRVNQIVVASSDKAYGTQPQLPYTETMPLQGTEPYEVSKSCTDLIAQSYFSAYGLPVAIARCGNIYGGGDLNWDRIIPHAIRAYLTNRPPEIRSDGSFLRDYIYVEDVVDSYLVLAERLDTPDVGGQAFNFGPGRAVSVLEVVRRIQVLMGCQHLEPLIQNTATGEIHDQYLDSAKALHVLNWHHRYNLDEGLRETITWYRHFLASGT